VTLSNPIPRSMRTVDPYAATDAGFSQAELDVASRKGPTGYVPPLPPRKISKGEFRAAVMFGIGRR
jgi:hypothetical protein